MSENEIEVVGFKERLAFAAKAAWHIILNRPIICYFDDSQIYARTNPFYMKAAAELLSEVADDQIADEIVQNVKNLVEIPAHRKN